MHNLTRVWCEDTRYRFTYAWRCSCGHVERGFISDTYARDDHAANHPPARCKPDDSDDQS